MKLKGKNKPSKLKHIPLEFAYFSVSALISHRNYKTRLSGKLMHHQTSLTSLFQSLWEQGRDALTFKFWRMISYLVL